ncbi:7-cyano-7-deazaguanine synthase QueC [bacterium]|nr:7-cyano-7-deazaguanine synthase QueC [bacterium]
MKKDDKQRAVVLLSGGLDSATVLAMARARGVDCYALSFRYGQRHSHELAAAKVVAETMGVKRHLILDLDFRAMGGSALTADIDVPKDRDTARMEDEIPITYVPARNIVFLSIALGWAETLHARQIHIGVNAMDYSGYPDCRPDFIDAFQAMANQGTKAGVEGHPFTIHTPLMQMTKARIIAEGIRLGVDYAMTHSCYDPAVDGLACGCCDSCLIRKKGFAEAGVPDPTKYMK